MRSGLLGAIANQRVESLIGGGFKAHFVPAAATRHLHGHLRGGEYLAEVVRCVESGVEEMNRKGADGYPRTIGQGFCPFCPCFAYVLAGRFHAEAAAGALV